MKETNQPVIEIHKNEVRNLAIFFSMCPHRFDYHPLHRGISGIKRQITSGGCTIKPSVQIQLVTGSYLWTGISFISFASNNKNLGDKP